MKRDMDLVRQILLKIEEHPHGQASGKIEVDGYSEEAIGFHCVLMAEADLIHGVDMTHFGSKSPTMTPTHMTWAGYDFLDAARNETIWRKVMGVVGERVGSVTFEVLKTLLVTEVKARLVRGS